MSEPTELIERLHRLKEAEAEARAARLDAEDDLIEALALPDKEEGSMTRTFGPWKVTVTNKLTRNFDPDAWAEVCDQVPANLRPVRMRLELDVKGLRWLADNRPDIYKIVSRCVTTKPAKTAVTIKRKD